MSDPQSETPTEHHRHAGEPGKSPFKVLFIVLASLVGVAIIAAIVWAVATSGGTPAPEPTTAAPVTPAPTPSPTTPPAPPAAALCTTDNSTAELGESNAAAGSVSVPIIFTNTGTDDCTLEGFPTVEFVGDGDGTQLGGAATQDTAASPVQLITIKAGNSAASILTITTADVEGCDRVDADGFRVIPPGSNDAFFLATTDYQACSDPNTSVLTVTSVDTN